MRIATLVSSLGPALVLALTTAPLAAQKEVKGQAQAQAQATGGGDVITQMTAGDVRSLLNEMDLSPQALENRDNAFRIQMGGRPVVVYLANSGQNIQLWTYLTGVKTSLDKINEWNKSKRFSRAYLDSDGDPNVEWDIDFEGGTTLGQVREGIRTFSVVVGAFKEFF